MKIYLPKNVYQAGLDRTRWVFNEFENVCVNVSGGKDSTVVLNLALQVAEEQGRLPLKVLFIDQEAEWQCVIDHVRDVMHDPRVDAEWLQVPIRLSNATSTAQEWLECWKPGDIWMRDKEPDSVHDNVYGTDLFIEMFTAWQNRTYEGQPAALLAGVRCEESPARYFGLTTWPCYKHVTWGRKAISGSKGGSKDHFTFYPIYDWALADVWHAINVEKWPYCSLYDELYRYGVAPRHMRVSNLHHTTAVRDLFMLQEIEPETWDKLTHRLTGINSAGQLQMAMFGPKQLPPMFDTWEQYRDHLLYNYITDPAHRAEMRDKFAGAEVNFRDNPKAYADLIQTEIVAILINDFHGTKMTTFYASHIGQSNRSGSMNVREKRRAAN